MKWTLLGSVMMLFLVGAVAGMYWLAHHHMGLFLAFVFVWLSWCLGQALKAVLS